MAVEHQVTRYPWHDAEERLRELGSARSDEPRDAEDLSAMRVEVDRPRGPRGGSQPAYLKSYVRAVTGRSAARRIEAAKVTPDHEPHHVLVIDLLLRKFSGV